MQEQKPLNKGKNKNVLTSSFSLEYVGSEAGKVLALRDLLKQGGVKPPILSNKYFFFLHVFSLCSNCGKSTITLQRVSI
jgi:hypothetical protein